MNRLHRPVWIPLAVAQVFVAGSLVTAAFVTPHATVDSAQQVLVDGHPLPTIPPDRKTGLKVTPLYDDPTVVSDADLARVLFKLRPLFPPERLRPNHVEHALRAWGVDATFRDPAALSGAAMTDVLLNHAKFLISWGDRTEPLLQETPTGVDVRWGSEAEASVHHDHLLASLTEAGVPLDHPVYLPGDSSRTFRDVLHQSLLDFELDERETEWSALAYTLWLPPAKQWTTRDGRQITFDMLAERLLRGDQRFGVCSGTHRVYSAMAMLRVDDEYQILSPEVRRRVWAHLETVRDRIAASQFPDGHWPSNWSEGAAAREFPVNDDLSKQVIATGHHLEWLAIAPEELHPPREQVRRAAAWLVKTVDEQSLDEIRQRYTFFSHVANALALWRQTSPNDFWQNWTAAHPDGLESADVDHSL